MRYNQPGDADLFATEGLVRLDSRKIEKPIAVSAEIRTVISCEHAISVRRSSIPVECVVPWGESSRRIWTLDSGKASRKNAETARDRSPGIAVRTREGERRENIRHYYH